MTADFEEEKSRTGLAKCRYNDFFRGLVSNASHHGKIKLLIRAAESIVPHDEAAADSINNGSF